MPLSTLRIFMVDNSKRRWRSWTAQSLSSGEAGTSLWVTRLLASFAPLAVVTVGYVSSTPEEVDAPSLSAAPRVPLPSLDPSVPAEGPSTGAVAPPVDAPALIGPPLGAAQSGAGDEGLVVRPTCMNRGPLDPTCLVVDQRPLPGEEAAERVIEVLIRCPDQPGQPGQGDQTPP